MIAIPILLFLLLAISFWLLTESKYHLGFRLACVVGFFLFGLIFWQNTKTFLGWAADGTVLYDVPITLHSVTIDEPTKISKGGIYVTVRQPPSIYKSKILRIFGHPIQSGSPRLYKFDYHRKKHEELESKVIPRFQKGQKGVRGMFKGPSSKGAKGGGKNKGKGNQKGEGSHSHESEFFHDIVPRYDYDKNRAPNDQPNTQQDLKYLI